MNRQTSVLRQLEDPTLNLSQRAELRCYLARELEAAGDYEAARGAMTELWQRIGERPQTDGLEQHVAAEVLLCTGLLTGWLGSAHQVAGAQEIAKDLMSESFRIFESLDMRAKAAEAQIEIALCYWREGAFDEARITLHNATGRLTSEDNELKALALLRSAIVEKSAKRLNDALHILNEAAPLIATCDSQTLEGNFHNTFAIVLRNLGTTEQRADYIDRALIEYAAASFHFEQAGHTRYRARVENNLGFLLFTLSRFDEAHEHLDHARRLFESLKDRGSVAQVDDTRARALLAQGRDREAEKIVQSAVRTLENGGEQGLLAEALTTHGIALARLGNDSQARFALQRAIKVAHVAGNRENAGLAALTMIEELGKRLEPDEMSAIYEFADELLADSEYTQTLQRLREAARRVLGDGVTRRRMIEAKPVSSPSTFVYKSGRMAAIMRDAQSIAATSRPVLMIGERGTGKELLARQIHEWSGRRGEFVALNCAAMAGTLTESQLFGHREEAAAETAADQHGAVFQAADGTLFLDEINELSAINQARLMRLIERGEVQSTGALELERTDVRVIAASQCDLREALARGLFREDLCYRLQGFHLELPPLRERPEDIPALAEYFINEAFERHGQRITFSPEAIEAMSKLPLKGNAGELQALIERTIATAPIGKTITPNEIETLALRQTEVASLADVWADCSLSEEIRHYEGRLIQMALDASQGHVTRAAHMLGTTHQGLAYILQGRHKDLLSARTPVRQRRHSIIKKKKRSRHGS
jgi:DNA-binding NtrC family response regulator/predicted negative regulator of RcsB-dependent stress response